VADLNDILTQLRAEIAEAIVNINVHERGRGESSFVYLPTSVNAIEETTGKPRLFSVRLAAIASEWCGVDLQRYDVQWEIKIGYPLRDWEIAVASDYDQIRTAINASAGRGAVTGVGYRVVTRDGFKLEKGTDWQFATMTIEGVVETTVTAALAYQIVDLWDTASTDGGVIYSYAAVSTTGIVRSGKLLVTWDASAGTVGYDDDYAETATSTDLTMTADMTKANGSVRIIGTSTALTWEIRGDFVAKLP